MSEKFKFSFSGLYDENLDHIEIDGVKFYPEKKLAQLERVAEAVRALIDTGCPVHAEFGLCPLCGQHYSKEHRDDCEWGMAEKALADLEPK